MAKTELREAIFGGLSRDEISQIFTLVSNEYKPRKYFNRNGSPKADDPTDVTRFTANIIAHSGMHKSIKQPRNRLSYHSFI